MLKSPNLEDISLQTKTVIHEVVLLAEKYNQDPFTALAVIKCESKFSPWASHLNINGTRDYSYFQVNSTHRKEALEYGLDITDPQDNLEYGMMLLTREGLTPWKSSRPCWENSVNTSYPQLSLDSNNSIAQQEYP